MFEMIDAREIDGKLYILASDHAKIVEKVFQNGIKTGEIRERRNICSNLERHADFNSCYLEVLVALQKEK